MKPTKHQQQLAEACAHLRDVLDSIDKNDFRTPEQNKATKAAEEFLKQQGERQ
jgi:hypothetical protein